MSKPRYIWWGYVKAAIRLYNPSGTAGAPSPLTVRERDAIRDTITQTERLPDGGGRLQLCKKVFWDKTHTLAGAAIEIPCSYSTAQRWHKDFISAVARNLGLL